MVLERYFQNVYYDNIGISYDAGSGTFTIKGANGRDLSPSNPAILFLPSKSTPGSYVRYKVVSNQNFVDDNGSSEIIGNLFGTTTGISWSQALPFFIYAVSNDSANNIQFMISRLPHYTTSPSAANIGAPDDPVADSQVSFWSLDNIDETLYDNNPCMCVGSFRMVKSASDDWTVQTINDSDGIGRFQENVSFLMPTNQNGAASGSHWQANGGTALGFNAVEYYYQIMKNGFVYVTYAGLIRNAGAGAVEARLSLPLVSSSNYGPTYTSFSGEAMYVDVGPNLKYTGISRIVRNRVYAVVIIESLRQNELQLADVGNNDDLYLNISYSAI